MAFYPPGPQPHSVYSPRPSVTAYPASSYHPSRRSRRHSTSSFSSYPLVPPGNYGQDPYPYRYGQGYSGVPTMASTSHNWNGQGYAIPQQPQGLGVPTIASTSHNWNGQGYTIPQQPQGVPTIASTSHNWNGQGYTIPQQPQPVVHQTQLPYFGNPYIPPNSTMIQGPGRTMGQGTTPHYNYQGNQSYYPMQGSQDSHPQTIVVKTDGSGRRRRRHHYRRRSSSY